MKIELPALTPFECLADQDTDYHEADSLIKRILEVQDITERYVYGIIYIGGIPFDIRIPIQLARELAEPGEVYYLMAKKPNPNLPSI